jgi:hypothetical protein
MWTDNKIAKGVAALFIITMILGMIDAYTVAPMLHTSLSNIASNESRVMIGAFSILLMAVGVVGIAILLYPVLERYNKFIAITYVSFRVMECLLLIVGVIVYFLLLTLSHEFINAGSPDASYFQTLSAMAIETRYSAYHVAMFILSIGSLMLCYLLYQTQIIPRFISIVGLVGYACVMLSAPLDILGVIDTTGTGGVLYVPGALFELFLLPIWLMVKGFDSSKSDSESA